MPCIGNEYFNKLDRYSLLLVFLNLTDNFSLLFCCFNSFRIITAKEGGREGGREEERNGGEGERWREEGETTELATVSCTLAELIFLTLLLSSESLSFSVRD